MSQGKTKTYELLLRWVTVALVAGICGNVVVQLTGFLIDTMQNFLRSFTLIPPLVWPILGAFPVGLVVYNLMPGAMGEGVPSYLEAVRNHDGHLSTRETLFNAFALVITLGTLGAGGILGPSGRLNAGLLSGIGRVFSYLRGRTRIIPLYPVCGMAGAVGAMLHSPVGAGVFAVEIILKTNIRYKLLFPAIMTSAFSVFIADTLGLPPLWSLTLTQSPPKVSHALFLLPLAVLCGLIAHTFILFHRRVTYLFERNRHISPLKRTFYMVFASLIAGIPLYILNPPLMGKSHSIFSLSSLMDGSLYGNLPPGSPLFVACLLLLVVGAVGASLTIGSGMTAGFGGTTILMGFLLGVAYGDFFGFGRGSWAFNSFLAVGVAGIFSGVMNTPIAAALITTEILGSAYTFPAILSSVISYIITRQETIYDLALIERRDLMEKEASPPPSHPQ